MAKLPDLVGQKFGRLTVIEYVGFINKRGRWKCLCECGNITIARTDALKRGDKKSCGCLNSEKVSERNRARNFRHGLAHTRLYVVWAHMRNRCNNPRCMEYKNYGGRGIKVCDEWDHDFMSFYEWAMQNGYDAKARRGECTIDRIDVNGDYRPDNCRFVGAVEQANNKRNNRRFTYNGITKTGSGWAKEFGMNRSRFSGPDDIIERRIAKYATRKAQNC